MNEQQNTNQTTPLRGSQNADNTMDSTDDNNPTDNKKLTKVPKVGLENKKDTQESTSHQNPHQMADGADDEEEKQQNNDCLEGKAIGGTTTYSNF